MCGIVGYIGNQKATPILLNGLSALEYRGYDSAGIAVLEKNNICILKDKGRVKEDIRAREIVASMFIDPSVFAESIKEDKPKNYMENDMPENINHSFVKTKLFNNENNAKKIKKIKAKQKVKSKQKTRKI